MDRSRSMFGALTRCSAVYVCTRRCPVLVDLSAAAVSSATAVASSAAAVSSAFSVSSTSCAVPTRYGS